MNYPRGIRSGSLRQMKEMNFRSGWALAGEWRRFMPTPRRRRELVDWLKQNPGEDVLQDDDWSQRCRDNFSAAACALCALARDNIWPAVRWRQALHVWSDDI